MTSTARIESVYPLITLPRPLNPNNGRVFASTVSTLSKSRKRKRYEIATCIDGENIGIYNVQNSHLVTSYAVPPQTTFSAKPCSVYAHGKNSRTGVRSTYAIAKSTPSEPPSIICFQEHKTTSELSKPNRLSRKLNSAEQVITIDVVETNILEEELPKGHDVLIVHRDASVECFTSDLSKSLWKISIPRAEIDSVEVTTEQAEIADTESIILGFLKSRDDLAAQFQGRSDTAGNHARNHILVSITKSRQDSTRHLILSTIRQRTSNMSRLESSLQHLVEWALPELPKSEQELSYTIDVPGGKLHAHHDGMLFSYDFSGLVPKLSTSTLDISTQSILVLPGSSILVASGSTYQIHDLQYNTVQDRRLLAPASPRQAKKRKRGEEAEAQNHVSFIDYFSKMGRAIAVQDGSLSAIHLQQSRNSKAVRLIDAIGKGVVVSSGHQSNLEEPQAKVPRPSSAEQIQAHPQLQDFTKNLDAPGYDRYFASLVGIESGTVELSAEHIEDAWVSGRVVWGVSPVNGKAVAWNFQQPGSLSKAPIFRDKALLALQNIFELESGLEDRGSTYQPKLKLSFFPPNTFHWLIITGQLTTELIEQAFRQYSDVAITGSLLKEDLVAAIAGFDPTFGLLYSLVQQHINLNLEDLVQAAKFIIRSLDNSDSSSLPAPKTLLANGDGNLTNSEPDIDQEADAAMEDLDHALSTLEHGLPIRGETLRFALTQMNAFPSYQITASLRSLLSQHEIIFLIHILRIELSDGGWTSKYIDRVLQPDEAGPNDHALSLIARLLSCAVDAISIAGWLSTTAENPTDSIDELLVSLRAETSAALEGIHEATFLRGLLNEFLRYGAKLQHSKRWGETKQIRIEREGVTELPLGLKVEGEEITTTKTLSGGRVVERSIRDIGMQISMHAVGKYSFERIRP